LYSDTGLRRAHTRIKIVDPKGISIRGSYLFSRSLLICVQGRFSPPSILFVDSRFAPSSFFLGFPGARGRWTLVALPCQGDLKSVGITWFEVSPYPNSRTFICFRRIGFTKVCCSRARRLRTWAFSSFEYLAPTLVVYTYSGLGQPWSFWVDGRHGPPGGMRFRKTWGFCVDSLFPHPATVR